MLEKKICSADLGRKTTFLTLMLGMMRGPSKNVRCRFRARPGFWGKFVICDIHRCVQLQVVFAFMVTSP